MHNEQFSVFYTEAEAHHSRLEAADSAQATNNELRYPQQILHADELSQTLLLFPTQALGKTPTVRSVLA
jgi:hypothetical protein